MAAQADPKPCSRCKKRGAPLVLRNGPSCGDCHVAFVDSKVEKRLGALNRETKTSGWPPPPRRYLAGLSFGRSSSAMVRILDASTRSREAIKTAVAIEPLVVHVDTDLSYPGPNAVGTEKPAQRLLAKYRERYPHVSFECVHLSKVMGARSVDWSALPAVEGGDDLERLRSLFDRLPSVTSRADVLRLLVRHLLLHLALERSYVALLLGHSTTALASLTLSEVANGRGFSVPWQVNDGPYTVNTYEQSPPSTDAPPSRNHPHTTTTTTTLPIYYPMREIFKAELATYVNLTPSLAELMIPTASNGSGNVVSHKDMSIEDVMGRYFDGVEGQHSGIVANVVRTAGKLDRAAGGAGACRLCGMALDKQGDSRWAGELGDEEAGTSGARLCYGCRRSLNNR